MDVTGLVLSAASLALQLGAVGSDIADHFKKAVPDDDDFLELSIQILHESEQSKMLGFVLFDKGTYGLEEGIFASLDGNNQKILFAILQRLFRIWREIRDLAAVRVFPLTATPPQAGAELLERADHPNQQPLGSGFDYEHAQSLLKTATAWNQKLERRIICYNILHTSSGQPPARSIERLNIIAQNNQCKALGWDTLARLRQLVMGIENPDIDYQLLPIPPNILIDQSSISSLRIIRRDLLQGLHGRESVLIETLPYFYFSRPPQQEPRTSPADRRVEELVAFLNIAQDAKFRIPKSKGYYHDPLHGRYCLVFGTPTPNLATPTEIMTLHSVLEASRKKQASDDTFKRPSLDDRFRLAYALTIAVSKFQSVRWLHQNIRSDNIVFAGPNPLHRSVDFSMPWLMGYGSSRSESASSVKIFDEDPIHNIYRHPDRWDPVAGARFEIIHDIYSLGVILLEISVWSSVQHLVKAELKAKGVSGNLVQGELLKLSKHPKVLELMGTQYSAIMQKCLKGKASAFGIDDLRSDEGTPQLELAFQDQVVDVLKKIVNCLE